MVVGGGGYNNFLTPLTKRDCVWALYTVQIFAIAYQCSTHLLASGRFSLDMRNAQFCPVLYKGFHTLRCVKYRFHLPIPGGFFGVRTLRMWIPRAARRNIRAREKIILPTWGNCCVRLASHREARGKTLRRWLLLSGKSPPAMAIAEEYQRLIHLKYLFRQTRRGGV